MPHELRFPDVPTASDALVFAQRAARLGDGAVRLRAQDGLLVMTSAPLAPRTLLEATPTILGMRIIAVDPEVVCDLVVDASTLRASGETHLALPDSAVTAPWAGISPPRSGWEASGETAAARLASRAQWGIAAVAEAVPTDAGAIAAAALPGAGFACEADGDRTRCTRTDGDLVETIEAGGGLWLSTSEQAWHPAEYVRRTGDRVWG